jgi:tripartite ATP-independent transporter DctM subunit
MLVILGSYAQISVGQLFAAALFPGLMLASLYACYVFVVTRFRPDWGPAASDEELAAVSKAELFKQALTSAVPPLLLILGVLGSIFAGIATTTEAASIGAFLTLILVIARGMFSWKMLAEALWASAKTSAMVLFVVVGATAFTGVFFAIGGAKIVDQFIGDLGLGPWGTFLIMMVVVFLLGMILDWLGIVLICLPVFLPIVISFGFDPMWFVMMVAIVLQTSFLTPPFGYALFYLEGVAPPGVTIGHIYRGILPFVALIVVGGTLCAVFPGIITWLPEQIFARGQHRFSEPNGRNLHAYENWKRGSGCRAGGRIDSLRSARGYAQHDHGLARRYQPDRQRQALRRNG